MTSSCVRAGPTTALHAVRDRYRVGAHGVRRGSGPWRAVGTGAGNRPTFTARYAPWEDGRDGIAPFILGIAGRAGRE